MDKLNIIFLQKIIRDYGVKDTVSGLIQALELEADVMSDWRLKEKSIQAADMADILRDFNGK